MKKNNQPDNLAYHNGACFSPKVDCELTNIRESKQRLWIGSVCVGEDYFETDQYRSKTYAISEMIGYLEILDKHIKEEVERLRKMLK